MKLIIIRKNYTYTTQKIAHPCAQCVYWLFGINGRNRHEFNKDIKDTVHNQQNSFQAMIQHIIKHKIIASKVISESEDNYLPVSNAS